MKEGMDQENVFLRAGWLECVASSNIHTNSGGTSHRFWGLCFWKTTYLALLCWIVMRKHEDTHEFLIVEMVQVVKSLPDGRQKPAYLE